MRIPIREQLGLLVLVTSLVALAVIAVATVSVEHASDWSEVQAEWVVIVDHDL